jgi:HlyD family secretion protein
MAAVRILGLDRFDQDPRPEIRLGLMVAGGFFVAFLGWAAVARMDAAAQASGQVTVASHRQTVQQKDGGVISAINVREGQRVKTGDILMELATPELQGVETSLAAQVVGLEAQRARLQAQATGLAAIQWPADFAALTGADKASADVAMRLQESQFRTQLSALGGQKGVLGQRSAEVAQQVEGLQHQIEANEREQTLIADELNGVKALAAKGYAPMTRVRELERAQAQLVGQHGQLVSSVAQSHEQSGEARLAVQQVDRDNKEQVAKDLRDVDFQLNDLTPRLNVAREQLARAQVRAPSSGAVVGLSVFTIGAVIAPGQKLLDIVPDRAAMVIEAEVPPEDADDLRVGQTAEVRFLGIRDRSLPILHGALTEISADSFSDEKTGKRFFRAEVSVPPEEIEAIQRVRGPSFALRAGLPVQILVPLRRRTALQYLLEPFTDAIWKSFREH